MFFKKNKDEKAENSELRDLTLDQKIEGILFFKGEEVSLKNLTSILEVKKKEILEAIEVLKERLKNSGIFLIENNNKFLLTTKPEMSSLIEKIQKKEEYGELSPSAIETLSVILYKKEITRAELDQIRGVNSSYILRNLLVRGLVEKSNENGSIKYIPTLDLMSFLGIAKLEDLPAFEKVRENIQKIENQNDENKDENGLIIETDNEEKEND